MDITSLFELRRAVKVFSTKYERLIIFAARFLTAFTAVFMINSRMGFNESLNSVVVTFLLSLLCIVLPLGFTAFFCGMLILVHLYTFSVESCILAMVIFVSLYLVYYHFSPHDAAVLLLTPILFQLHIPTVIPFVVGLVFTPVSAVSMCFGTIIWFFLKFVVGSAEASSIENVEGAEESLGRIQSIIGGFTHDKTVIVYCVGLALAAISIYVIKRLSINKAWQVAVGAGAFIELIVLLIGKVALDANVGIIGAIIGTVLGAALGTVIIFLVFNVDYSHIEITQFEDDEYYYYVKAVPKYVLNEKSPRSKSINRSVGASSEARRPSQSYGDQSRGRSGRETNNRLHR